jgi:DNA-binding NarL/FixJ family response regulator
MYKILVIEDNVVDLIELEEGLTAEGYIVVGTSESGSQAVSMAETLAPDLILMDIKLSGQMDGIDAAQKIKSFKDIPIIFLTGHSDMAIVKRASMVHPQGFILKPYTPDQIKAAIEIAIKTHEREKNPTEDPEMPESILTDPTFLAAVTEKVPNLTCMELRIVHLVRQGLRTKEIAERLDLSRHTVSWHRNNIRTKLGLDCRNTNLMTALNTLSQKPVSD